MENRKNIKTLTFPKLEPWQYDVVKILDQIGPTGNSFIIVRSRRQCGKSFLINGLLLRTAINFPNTNSCCVSLTYKNTSKLFKELCDGLDSFEYVSYINKANMEIGFKNKSTISFRSASQGSALRGYSLYKNSLLCIDEGAFIKEETWGEILPWAQANKCNTLVVSTPLLKRGQFYQFFKAGIDNVQGFYSVDWNKYDTSKYLTPERIEMYRKILSPSAFRSEIMGEFVDNFESLFNLEQDIWHNDHNLNYNWVSIGLDWAVGNNGDYSVMSGFDNTGKQILLEYCNNKKPEEQLQWFSSIINKMDHNKVEIHSETNSLGAVYTDRLCTLCPQYNIKPFITSNSSKREIIEYLISRTNSGNIKYIDDQEQHNQLLDYRMEITKSGAITYNGRYEHDDIVMANAMAMYGIKQLETNANYSIRFNHKSSNIKRKLYEKYR